MEEIIYAGSPYWISVTSSNIGSASIRVRVWEGQKSTFPATGYERTFVKSAVNGIIAMDISDVILHEIPNITPTVSPAVWVEVTVAHTAPSGSSAEYTESETLLALGGYTQGGQIQKSVFSSSGVVSTVQSLAFNSLLQASTTVFSLEGSAKNGTILQAGNNSAAKLSTTSVASGFSDSGKTAFVEPLYRFTPYRLRFENRYGVLEDIWLAKRSIPIVTVNNDSFTRSNFDYSTLTYDNTAHVEQQYNSVGYRKWHLNTGWMTEAFNVTLEDIYLSNNKWIIDNAGNPFPVILESKGVQLKTILNETVIEYGFDFRETTPINNVIR